MVDERDELSRRKDWLEYRQYVLLELERLGKVISQINDKVDRLRVEDLASFKTDIALLKFQAAMWGAGGGIVFGAIITFILKRW
jgi:hypothetical protein